MKFHIYAFLILFLCAFFFAPSADAATIGKPMQSLGLVGYWSFDVGKGGAKAVDMSGRGNNGTLTNMNTTAAWVGGKIGNALSFDGSNDLIVLGSPAALDNIGGSPGSKTITAWIYPTGWGEGNLGTIWQKGSDAFGSGWNFQLKNDAAPLATFRGTIGGATPGVATAVANTISLNNWQFVAITYIGADGGPRLWIGGEEVSYDSRNDVTTYASDASSNACVGNRCGADRTFKGSIDEVRIYNRALSADEIKRLYRQTSPQMNASQANKLRQGLVGMWTFDGVDMGTTSAIDRSGNANTGWLINGTKKSIGKIGQALNFDGGDDYVTASNPTTAVNNWTMAAWINPTQLNVLGFAVQNGPDDGVCVPSTNCAGYGFGIGSGGGLAGSKLQGVASIVAWIDSGYTFPSANTWYHVIMLRDNGTIKFYVNGVQTSLTSSAVPTTPTNYFRVGSQTGIRFFPGLIDEVRVYNRALTPTEIRQLYKAGSSFHPNTTNKSTIRDGLVGHWTFDGADMGTTSARDASGNANTGWLINGAKKAIGRIGQALNFDGVDDLVNLGSPTTLDNVGGSPGSKSITAWIKPNSLGESSVGRIWDKGTFATTGWFWFMYPTNSLKVALGGSTVGQAVAVNNSLTLGIWSFVVATYKPSDGGPRLWVNGAEVTYSVVVGDERQDVAGYGSDAADTAYIGNRAATDRTFNGLIDDVRVYNRALSPAEIKRLYNMGR